MPVWRVWPNYDVVLPEKAAVLMVDIKKIIGYRKLQIVYSGAFQAVYGVITI